LAEIRFDAPKAGDVSGRHTGWLTQTVEGADFRWPQTRTFTWPSTFSNCDWDKIPIDGSTGLAYTSFKD